MRLHRTLSPIVFILSLLFWPALVYADFQAGLAAYNQGDYATALKEWRPLAEQGYAPAQFNLGFLYDNGYGVPVWSKNSKPPFQGNLPQNLSTLPPLVCPHSDPRYSTPKGTSS